MYVCVLALLAIEPRFCVFMCLLCSVGTDLGRTNSKVPHAVTSLLQYTVSYVIFRRMVIYTSFCVTFLVIITPYLIILILLGQVLSPIII